MYSQDRQEVKLPFYLRLTSVLLCIVLILFLMHEGRSIIIPLFFSLLIALLLLPLTHWLERRKVPRTAAALLSILIFLLFISGIFYFLGAQLFEFSRDLPEIGNRVQAWINDLQTWISNRYHIDASQQLEYINNVAMDLARYASLVAQAFLLALGGFAIWTVFVFIFTFFILTHRRLLTYFITCLFRPEDQQRVDDVLGETRSLANSYVVGLLIEMVLVAAMNIIAFLLFGVKYAFLLGVLAAVLNIIPFFGIYTATAIAALITLGNSTPHMALLVIVILLIIHFIDANILMPRIVGRRVKMNPLITLVAVLSGNLLWGISGTFLFIPLAGILKIIFGRVEGFVPWALLMGTEDEIPLGRVPVEDADKNNTSEEATDS
jgi:predicted PurR-regulated permease PerM